MLLWMIVLLLLAACISFRYKNGENGRMTAALNAKKLWIGLRGIKPLNEPAYAHKSPGVRAGSIKQLKPSCKMQLGFYRCSHYMAECNV